ncbi:ABC transporter substrate-binding protein [Paracoccus saliphilus]|uniref:ABC transporter substrate-binding protein n=1 Tax=Paracoccus saliphilus TaxID=405559 RepID=A0AA46A4U8_9RHOB|nr:ABC transporter substrate-binding protein [Paracoccus saliphilus]WCR01409.1 ABC transporter substrate-binding protein [Paracoccus saliphilus]SIS69857.1 putative spermidine/putrescine transport system substrate-binding protein [Paracoccus saliphilus]
MKMKTALLSASAIALLTGPVFAQELTVVSWGGALQEAQTKAFMKPYAETTGTKIVQDTWSGELAKLRAMVDSGNVVWDAVDVDPQTGAIACEQGLLEPIGSEEVFQALDLVEGALLDCAVGTSTYATILAFKKDAFADGPKSLVDIFDTARFPGKRSFRKSPVDTLEAALLADGVAPTEIYSVLSTPEGVDRAFAKLDTIKDDIVWWEAGAQPAQLLMSGEVAMALAWNGRIADVNANENADLGIAWSNQIRGFDMWTIPVGAKNGDAARDFILTTLQPATNAEISKYIAYGPTVVAAADSIDAETLENLPSAPQNSEGALAQDGAFWAKNGDALNAKFSAWIAR